MVPATILGLAGVTAIEESVAAVTVREVVPDLAPNVAVIVVVPAAAALARPVAAMVALEVSEELHVTDVVRSLVVLSENVPVAVNCCVVRAAMLGLVGVTAMDTSVMSLPPPPPLQPVSMRPTISKQKTTRPLIHLIILDSFRVYVIFLITNC